MNDSKVLVVGAGIMGHGIAEACAIAGCTVFLNDTNRTVIDAAMHRIGESLAILARKGKLHGEDTPRTVLGRVHPCTSLDGIAPGIGVVIEAVPENLVVKRAVFREVDAALSHDFVFATNSSTIPVSKMASATSRPENAIGMHFFNPVPLMLAVEVIPGAVTSPSTVKRAMAFLSMIGKVPVPVHREPPGFVVNRVQAATQVLVNRVVDRGLASCAQIDAVARLKNLPMGPFEVYDFVGLDTVKHILDYFATNLDEEFASPRWLDDLVAAGRLGRKTGRGIYDWGEGHPSIDLSDPASNLDVIDMLSVQVNEACKLVDAGCVEDPVDIDVAIMLGTGNKSGIFGLLSAGRDRVIARLDELASMVDAKLFRPHPLLATIPVPNGFKEARARAKAAAKQAKVT